MSSAYFHHRRELLAARLSRLAPSLERARQAVRRLELEPIPAGAAGARAARISAARTMAATLFERERQLQIALAALQAEAAED